MLKTPSKKYHEEVAANTAAIALAHEIKNCARSVIRDLDIDFESRRKVLEALNQDVFLPLSEKLVKPAK